MTWFTSSTNETEAAKEHCIMFLAVDFDFSSGHARFWTGIGDLVISGNTYLGTGDLGHIDTPEERASLSFEGKLYQLAGVDPALISEADIDASFGRSVTEYFGFLNPDTRALVDTPEVNWEGRIDSIRRVDGSKPLIEVRAEHRLVLIDQADDWAFTHEHQQQFFASDLGFDRIPSMELKQISWGGHRVSVPGSTSGGNSGRRGNADKV